MKMPCDEWCRLVERYQTAVNAYNQAVNALGVLPGAAFSENWSRAERARAMCNRHRVDLWHLLRGWPATSEYRKLETESMVLGDRLTRLTGSADSTRAQRVR
jgi:hypothetical protein